MNVVLQKILGTLDYQVRRRTSSGNTHWCYDAVFRYPNGHRQASTSKELRFLCARPGKPTRPSLITAPASSPQTIIVRVQTANIGVHYAGSVHAVMMSFPSLRRSNLIPLINLRNRFIDRIHARR
jgi:hypothetical protein